MIILICVSGPRGILPVILASRYYTPLYYSSSENHLEKPVFRQRSVYCFFDENCVIFFEKFLVNFTISPKKLVVNMKTMKEMRKYKTEIRSANL